MKKIKYSLFLICFTLSAYTFAQETITNETVIQMVELGFSDDIIIDKINTSDVKFETSIAELSKLKKANVSSDIISLIMKKSKHNTKSRTGIYYAVNGEQKHLPPSVFSGSNSNSAAQKLVSGFINSKKRAVLPKIRSNNVLPRPLEFTFVFDPSVTEVDNLQTTQGNSAGILNWWFRTASSPNEFVLVKLTVKERKNTREVIIGKKSWVSSQSGIDPKYAIPFNIEEIESNKFKVTIDNLEAGEYAFLYQGQVPQGRSNQSVFDFSVQ
ncbi:hypothetical protein MWU58_04915 [Flavobacteriaceae bacterium S0825]|uniref:hypothetical protein n=1 Tax=Gaetbulibacter sp. S0825 TaxID=2720084 RepID=UPI0014312EF6|nr:hypothetical protein [Gaetbulibacter sp. S0825]MCK0108622.1 hypothetical protein [Flavobacteriaceae bacterium S0825]NIX64258.1 hypothetical protein [Gaetbulibacter sp. S0825]